jgi:hypothetical protein
MPFFPLIEFSPEVTGSISRESSLASGEGSVAREAQIHGGTGGIAPASLTPGTFGLGTAPLRENPIMRHAHEGETFQPVTIPGTSGAYYVRARKTKAKLFMPRTGELYRYDPNERVYTRTGLRAHSDSRGQWALDDGAASHATAVGPHPGTSHAPSSQPASGVGPKASHVLEDLLSRPIVRPKKTWRFRDQRIFRTFHGKKLPHPLEPTPNRDYHNRKYVAEQVASVFERLGYKARVDVSTHLQKTHLDVINSDGEWFRVDVKLSRDGKITPAASAPWDRPYLVAVVDIDARDGTLQALRVVALKHPKPVAVQPAPVRQPGSIWRPYLE